MKSIMQEGSSVLKAIEKAWEVAGKPKEFSIKVFEEQQKNFLGMTTKSAKIAIFFDGKIIEPERVKAVTKSVEAPKKVERKKEVEPPKPAPVQNPSIWSESMIKFTEQWIKETLAIMQLSDVSFTLVPDHYQLKIVFSKPINTDEEKERSLFRNFSLFIMQALRHKFHRPMRGFYVAFGHD